MIIWEFEKKNGRWHKIFNKSVKTAFYVSRGTFWGQFNSEKKFTDLYLFSGFDEELWQGYQICFVRVERTIMKVF